MLKVRLMGTKNDIVWFQKILQRHPKVEVLEISELYSNKGTNKYYRAYAEVQKSNVNSPNFHNRDRYSICTGQSYGKSWYSGAGQTGNYTCNHYGIHYQ